ncbi:MAG: hypothetical protein AAF211_07240 [Myxococcota bacterium]
MSLRWSLTTCLGLVGCLEIEAPDDRRDPADPTEPMEDDDCDDDEQAHECTPYLPTVEATAQSGMWSEPNDRQDGFFSTPSDPGGGILTVTLEASDDSLGPWLLLDFDSMDAAAVTSGGEEPGDAAVHVIQVGPGETYTADVYPFFNADLYPVSFTLSWAFDGRMDCYEPNDDLTNAKAIPTNQPIEAYALGRRDGDRMSYPTFDDFYRFETQHPDARVELTGVPPNLRMKLGLYEGPAETDSARGLATGESLALLVEEPGTYFLQVAVLSSDTPDTMTEPDDERPDHWDTPYALQIVDLP